MAETFSKQRQIIQFNAYNLVRALLEKLKENEDMEYL